MDIVIDETLNGVTVKEYLFSHLNYSAGIVKKLKFRENGICVNGAHATVRYTLKTGDVLTLNTEDSEEDTCPYMIPVDLPLKIAFEDDWVTVVDKPPMMPAHPSFSHRLDTVANALAFRYSDAPFVFRPVNRLDRDTSGLMLTSRTRLSASRLYEAMIGGKISKLYIALLSNTPEKKSGIIKTYMRREEGSIIRRCVCNEDDEKAKIAVTAYKELYSNDRVCAVAAAPITGRTHQLRIHFSHIGCPLLGDTMYGGDEELMTRHGLHSACLSFPHPETTEECRVFSPLPDDMRAPLGEEGSRMVDEAFKAELSSEDSEIRAMCREYSKAL